jgi:hypothetical protein
VTAQPTFDPEALLRALVEADVRFVVIGGIAAQVLGSPSLTADLDICYERSRDNLKRLVAALSKLGAFRRGAPELAGLPLDAAALRVGDVFTLSTRYGALDLVGNPAPGLDYEVLLKNALRVQLHGTSVAVAGLDDLIAMKRAAGRPKDRVELEILGALREELDRHPSEGPR